MTNEQQAMEFIDKFWTIFAWSWQKNGRKTWNEQHFPHLLTIITGIDLVTGKDYHNSGQIIGWNIICIGKNDCTIVGVVLAAATFIRYYNGDICTDKTVSQELGLAFNNYNMQSEKEDILVHFLSRLNMKNGVEAWLDGRVGRVSDRKDWGKITFDHNNPDFRAKIRGYFKQRFIN